MSNRPSSSLSRSLTFGSVLGGVIGIVAWGVLAFGLAVAVGKTLWIGHVFSSPINGASFAAFGAAVGQLLQRWRRISREKQGMVVSLLPDGQDVLVLPEDARNARKRLHEIAVTDLATIPLRLLSVGLLRARANWSATDVSDAIEAEASLIQDETDASYSNIRYLAWAIPSIGFIGTVLGIGWAMGDMNLTGTDKGSSLAVASGHLSVAFDTTFVALVLSLVLMYMFHRIQARDDELMIDAKSWCLHQLPLRMHTEEKVAL